MTLNQKGNYLSRSNLTAAATVTAKEDMDYTKIITKLIGPIEPVGETNTDNERFENLKSQCKLVEELIMRIQYVANSNKGRHEHSMQRAGNYADLFLTKTIGIEP